MSEESLASIAGWLKRYTGLSYPARRWNELDRVLKQAMAGFGFQDAKRFADWLMASSPPDRSLIESLAGHLTVGETYFFREGAVYQILEEKILPEIIRERRDGERRLRLWSAGCSTGEEAYTLAILLHRLLPDRKDWNLAILGTDINPVFLNRAEKGEFGSWSLRECPGWIRDRYFRSAGANRYALLPEIRDMVTFSYLNLAEDAYPSLLSFTNAMDLILCRNVLMYFAEETATTVVSSLTNCLLPGGWLALSSVESAFVRSGNLTARRFPKAILYRKDGKVRKDAILPETIPAREAEIGEPGTPATLVGMPRSRGAVVRVKKPREIAPVSAVPVSSPWTGTSLETAGRLVSQGKYREAIGYLRETGGDQPEVPAALALLARCHANLGALEEALGCCDRALASDRLAVNLHYLRYTILHEEGREEEARESLGRTLYLDPDFILGHFTMFVLNRRRGNRKEAERHRKIAEKLLEGCGRDDLIPGSDGMSAGRLMDTLRSWPAA